MNYPIQTDNQYSKDRLTQGWTEFFDSIRNDYQLLTMTIVFKPTDNMNSKERWESEYSSGVLKKIRKAIEPNPSNRDNALPYDGFFYFERFESNRMRNAGRRKPFHIHSVLPIRKSQLHRIWSRDTNNLTPRLLKDIRSLGTVQSILVEPLRDGHTIDWIRYITKQKQI